MTRREFILTTAVTTAAIVLPISPIIAHYHEKENPMASLMAILLDMTDDEFHSLDSTKRKLLMSALYETLGDDPEIVSLLADSIGVIDRRAMQKLHEELKERALKWYSVLDETP